jgi:hypothetical protein
MHKAALNGHLPVVVFLVSQGTDVQARDADGWTALHNACSKVLPTPAVLLNTYAKCRDISILYGTCASKAELRRRLMVFREWTSGVRAAGLP